MVHWILGNSVVLTALFLFFGDEMHENCVRLVKISEMLDTAEWFCYNEDDILE